MKRLGATPEEWNAFTNLCPEDIKPFVCNLNTPIAINSSLNLANMGKVPSQIATTDIVDNCGNIKIPHGVAFGMLGWSTLKSTLANINEWRLHEDLGFGIVCRNIFAIDIDITEKKIVDEVLRYCYGFLGREINYPVRSRSDSSKKGLLFRVSDATDMIKKHVIKTQKGMIEFLFSKQFFACCGTHKEGKRYEWLDGIPNSLEDIPSFTIQELQQLLDGLRERFGRDPEDRDIRLLEYIYPSIYKEKIDHKDDPFLNYLNDNGWIKHVNPDGSYTVTCPWEKLHTTESGATTTIFWPRGFHNGNGGFKCLHAHCQDKNIQDFIIATGFQEKEIEAFDTLDIEETTEEEEQGKVEAKLEIGRKGIILPTLANCITLLEAPNYTKIRIRKDNFTSNISMTVNGGAEEMLSDERYTEIYRILTRLRVDTKLSKPTIREAVAYVAEHNVYDWAQDQLKEFKWDGVERIDRFFARVCRKKQTPYLKECSRYLWSALAGRILEPGVKTDMVPILIGAEGVRKSTFVRQLPFFDGGSMEIDLNRRDEDIARMMTGKVVGELDELKGMRSKGSEAILSWITRTEDSWVVKFSEFSKTWKRRFVVVGTTNNARCLSPSLGMRRWLPIDIYHLKAYQDFMETEWLINNKIQLWAEAVILFKKYGVCEKEANALAEPARLKAKELDLTEISILRFVNRVAHNGEISLTIEQVATGALGLSTRYVKAATSRKINDVLLENGFICDKDGNYKKEVPLKEEDKTKNKDIDEE